MPNRDYYERLWEDLPVGLTPSDFPLRRRFLLEHIDPGERVLDVGCGEGWFAGELLRAGAQVVAVDVAPEPLRRARARQPELDLRLLEPGLPWPLDDVSFDAVWAGEVIEHVADTAGWLSELRRVLRPGGKLLLSTPAHARLARLRLALSRHAFDAHFDPRSDHLRFYTRSSLIALLEDFGFSELEVRAGQPMLARALRSRF